MGEPLEQALAPGTMVGSYRVEYRVGAGGVGTVYAAEEPTIKKRVAIKVLKRAFAEDEAGTARFEREARAANAVHHPGIVDVFALGRLDDGRPYLVMSLLEGRSLRSELDDRRRLPPKEAWILAREIASALSAAHAEGIVHRDLKPDNVFLEKFGEQAPRPRILDFGIAKVPSGEDGEAMQKLTSTGTPIGTPRYMAPEQWWAQEATPSTDQYCFGVMLFEMIAGRAPFVSQQFLELAQQHLHEPPPTFASLGVDVPQAVERLLGRMLAKSKDDRFASMVELVAAADEAFASSAMPAEPSGATDPSLGDAATMAVPSAVPVTESTASAPTQKPLRRFLAMHAAVVVFGAAALVALGYAGPDKHSVRVWMLIGGMQQILGVVLGAIGVVGLGFLARRRAQTGRVHRGAFVLALLPAVSGALGTYTGWMKSANGVPLAAPTDQFVLLSQGMFEANASRFMGFSMAALLCVSLSAMPGVSGLWSATRTLTASVGLASREGLAGAGVLFALAIIAIALGAPSAGFVAGVAAVVLIGGALLPTLNVDTAARDEIERAVTGLLAVGLATAVAFTRIEAREGILWGEEPTRAARVAEIVSAHGERVATTVLALVSLAVVASIEAVRLARLFRKRAFRPTIGTAILVTVLALAVAGDAAIHGHFVAQRDGLRASIGEEFALFVRLDPPPGDELDPEDFKTHRATAMQVTRDAVAVNTKGVAKLAVLESPDGASRVAVDLGRTLAQASVDQKEPSEVDLSAFVDREVPTSTLLLLLRIAKDAGARRVDLVLGRGPPPRIPPDAPAETQIVIPRDFVAVPIVLVDRGFALDARTTFGAAAHALVERARALNPNRPSSASRDRDEKGPPLVPIELEIPAAGARAPRGEAGTER